MGRLDNKVAVITGAASGMGRATAIRFAGEGSAVVVADLNEEGGAATVRECKESGGRAVFHKTDVAAETEIKALIARAISEFGRLDITFNNATFDSRDAQKGGGFDHFNRVDCGNARRFRPNDL